jgi:hypothetical protein
MLIEGGGNLLLEDFRPAAATPQSTDRTGLGLFSAGEQAGPSKTLIEWKKLMLYDFANDQTRFEGDVELKHFSGLELQKRFGGSAEQADQAGPGRAAFLSCDVLTVDFFQRGQRTRPRSDRRMGRLSADRIRRFQAHGAVELQDPSVGLWLSAMRAVYERDRDLLAVEGSQRRPAHIVQRRVGRSPTDLRAESVFYNTLTGKIEASGVIWHGR